MMGKEHIEREAAKHIKPTPVLGEWFDHGTDYITKYQALDIVAANNITTEMTLKCYDKIVDGIYKIPAADVKPANEIVEAVDEAIRVLNAINSRGNETFDYGDYCDLYDAISAIYPT